MHHLKKSRKIFPGEHVLRAPENVSLGPAVALDGPAHETRDGSDVVS